MSGLSRDQIPPQVRDALERFFYEEFRFIFSHGAMNRAAAVVVNSWPGMQETDIKWKVPGGTVTEPSIILPLEVKP